MRTGAAARRRASRRTAPPDTCGTRLLSLRHLPRRRRRPRRQRCACAVRPGSVRGHRCTRTRSGRRGESAFGSRACSRVSSSSVRRTVCTRSRARGVRSRSTWVTSGTIARRSQSTVADASRCHPGGSSRAVIRATTNVTCGSASGCAAEGATGAISMQGVRRSRARSDSARPATTMSCAPITVSFGHSCRASRRGSFHTNAVECSTVCRTVIVTPPQRARRRRVDARFGA